MDGVHDMGGLQGFGPIGATPSEPAFHHDWERRTFGLMEAARRTGGLEGRFRHAIERMDPVWYLEAPYYERWLTGVATSLVEAGVIELDELDDRLGAPFTTARPVTAPSLVDPGPSLDRPRFSVGDPVRVRDRHPSGHTRAPRYVRGKPGTVVRVDDAYSVPDVEYHCTGRRREPTYGVRFEALEIWGEPGDPVHVDLWDSYLQEVDDER